MSELKFEIPVELSNFEIGDNIRYLDAKGVEQITDGIVEALGRLPQEIRLEVMCGITAVYCQHCGVEQPKESWDRCQCWNDE